MKKFLAIVLVFVLPVLIFANAFTNLMIAPKPGSFPSPQNRSFRLSELVFSDFFDSNWDFYQKSTMHYSDSVPAQLDSIVDYYYSDQDQEWYEDASAFITYNAAGRITQVIRAISEPGWFVPLEKLVFEYDNLNRLIHMYNYVAEWGGTYVPVHRVHIEYVSNNELTAYSWENWEEREEYYWKTTFGFDTQGRMNLETNYESPDSLNWFLESKTEHTYHPQDNTPADAFVNFIAHDLPLGLVFDYYDYPGLITQSIWSEWEDGGWEISDKEVRTYDDQFRKTMTEYMYWYEMDWHCEDRELFYYDTNGNLDYTISQWIYWEEFEDDSRVDYTWETYTANDDPVSPVLTDLALRAYPQPFTESMTIVPQSKHSAEIKIGIYNARGQLVKSLTSPAGMSISWDGRDDKGMTTATGIYFIRAEQAGHTATIKTVKLK